MHEEGETFKCHPEEMAKASAAVLVDVGTVK